MVNPSSPSLFSPPLQGKQPAAGQKSKEAKSKAASQSSKAKGSKVKKVDSRVREKANLAVFLDKATYEKAKADVPKMKLITVSTVVDRLKVNGYKTIFFADSLTFTQFHRQKGHQTPL